MSYTIEYNRALYEREDKIIWMYRIGDSNVTELDGTPAKDWKLAGIYSKAEFIKRVCEIAGECEGGSLQFQSKSTTPEDYLARYRKLKPKPFAHFFTDFHNIEGIIYFDEDQPQPTSEFTKELEEKSFVYSQSKHGKKWICDIRTPEDFDMWYSYYDLNYNPSKTGLIEKLNALAPLELTNKFWINGIGFTTLNKGSLSNGEINIPLSDIFENDLRTLHHKLTPDTLRYWAYMYFNQNRVRVC